MVNGKLKVENVSSKYHEAYNAIRKLKETFTCVGERFPPFLVGLCGELLVKMKLAEKGISFKSKGGQGGYDIRLENGKKIEVRSSLLKNEGLYPKDVRFFGWRIKKRGKEVGFDYLLCVAFDDDLANPKIYLFTKEEALKAGDVEIPRFKGVQKKLHLFRSHQEMEKAVRYNPRIVSNWEVEVNKLKHEFEFEKRWEILKV